MISAPIIDTSSFITSSSNDKVSIRFFKLKRLPSDPRSLLRYRKHQHSGYKKAVMNNLSIFLNLDILSTLPKILVCFNLRTDFDIQIFEKNVTNFSNTDKFFMKSHKGG